MYKLASEAGLWYNGTLNTVVSGDAANIPDRINLYRRFIMDTLPPHANNGKSPSIPNASGIYKITCLTNGKIYIGSAINLRGRKNTHFGSLQQNRHANLHLQHAWNKYGAQAFTFEVLELVLPICLTAREQYWFNKLKPFGRRGFNILPIAGSPSGYKHRSESIEKIQESNRRRKLSPETIERMRQSQLGKKRVSPNFKKSPEHREKLRQSHLGKKHSPEHREKVRLAGLGRRNSPEAIEKQRQALLGREKSPEHREKLRQAALKRHELSSIELEAIMVDRASGMTYRQLIKKYGVGGTRLAQLFRGEV